MPNMRVGLVIDWETVCVYYGSSYWDVIEHRSNCVSLRSSIVAAIDTPFLNAADWSIQILS